MSTSSGSIKRQQTMYVPQDIYINNNKVWHAGTLAKSEFAPSSHVGAGDTAHAAVNSTTNGFMIFTDKNKLDGISSGATKTSTSTTNGNILIDGVEKTVYTHPTTAGNIHLPSGGATGQWVKWSALGTGAWTAISWTDVGSKPATFTPPIATSSVLGGVKPSTGLTVAADGTLTWTHPTGSGNNHIPSGGVSGNALKWSSDGVAAWGSVAWTEVSSKPTTFTPSAHTHAMSELYSDDAKTTTLSSYLSSTYATKTDLSNAGSVTATGNNTLSGQNTFTKADGPAIVIRPSSTPATNTLLMQMTTTTGSNLVTFDAEGDVTINGNLTVVGTTTYNGTNSVDGDYSISGNLTVAGGTTLGDASTDQTTVKGDLRLEGNLLPIGKYVEVHRRPLFGIAGDLQFQMDSTVFENIGGVNYNPTAYANPAVASTATRYYRLYVVYSDDITDTQATNGQKATIRLLGYTNNTIYKDLDIPNTFGDANMRRDWYSVYFTDIPTQHIQLQAKLAQTGNSLGIRWIELIAYDKY